MNYHVCYTNQLKSDLKQVLGYIKSSLKNPQAARNLLSETERALASLSQMPERYALADDALLASWGIRLIRVRNYLAFYIVDSGKQTVQVIRFLYGKSDWHSILREGHDPR